MSLRGFREFVGGELGSSVRTYDVSDPLPQHSTHPISLSLASHSPLYRANNSPIFNTGYETPAMATVGIISALPFDQKSVNQD